MDILLTQEYFRLGERKDVDESDVDWCFCRGSAGVGCVGDGCGAAGQEAAEKKDEKVVVTGTPRVTPAPVPTADSTTEGTVTVGGQTIAYKAVAGTLTVGSTDAQDATLGL